METEGTRDMGIDNIVPSPFNPRQDLTPESLAPLVQSIRDHGMIGPILIRPHGHNRWECIAGSRRLEATRLAGLSRIPVIICRRVSDQEALEIGLIENLQREDLNPIEEAEGYRRLRDEFGFTQAKIAERMGKRQMHVSHALSLLKLPEDVQEAVRRGEISKGHGHILATVDDRRKLKRLAKVAPTVTCHVLDSMVQAVRGPKRKRVTGDSLSSALRHLTTAIHAAAEVGWAPAAPLVQDTHPATLMALTHYIRTEAGLPPLDNTPPDYQKARELAANGLSFVQIGAEMGVSDTCVRQWLQKAGWQRDPTVGASQ